MHDADAVRPGDAQTLPQTGFARAAHDPGRIDMAELKALNEDLERTIAALEAQNLQFAVVLESISQGICLLDAWQRVVVCNRRYADLYGLEPEHVRPGTSLREILERRVVIGSVPVMPLADYLKWVDRLALTSVPDISSVELSDGRIIEIRHQPMLGGGWVSTHEDVTEARRAVSRIAYMAHHDELTGLANRALLRERLNDALTRARRGAGCAVLCIDLDHFKIVNDTLGHKAGDILLRAATERLQQHLRESDTLARLGGDEFAIVQSDVEQVADCAVLAGRVVQVLSAPFDLDGQQVTISASVGIAVAPGDGDDSDTLLRNADIALYRSKSDGRNCCRFFEPGMDAAMQARRQLELDLRAAVACESFELHYQPLMNVRTRRVSAFEALLRWTHPVRGRVPPLDFIPLAEEIGLIVPIGAWVLRQACQEAATWPGAVCVAVNISAVQFRKPGLVEAVADALQASGLPACRLELEVTESTVMESGAATLDVLRQVRALGVRIAMDDFGTGYSSLGSLRNLPFDKIKIDQSFVRELTHRPDSIAIIRAVAGICDSLGMTTTAEGVETSEQLALLTAERCTEVQGYLFSRPRPVHELPALLRALSAEADAPP